MHGILGILGGILLLAATGDANAQTKPIEGNWRSPSGSIVRVYECGDAVCLKIMQVEKSAPGTEDANNPDPKLRSRSLCGLEIGSGFKPEDGGKKADRGALYDPKSGKTYSGVISAEGDLLRLRGYVGLKMFGRSEEWNRVNGPVDVCRGS